MLDSYTVKINNRQALNINAVSGTIIKTYRQSFIMDFEMNSRLANMLLDKKPYLYDGIDKYGRDKERDVVVLQVMLCGNDRCVAEIMWKDEFDDLFKIENHIEGEKPNGLC